MACEQPWEQWGVPNCRLEPIGYASTSEQRTQSRLNGIVSLVSGTGGVGFRARYSVTTSGEIDRRWNLPVQGALAGTLRRQGSPNDADETGRSCRPRCLYLLLCRIEETEDGGEVRADVGLLVWLEEQAALSSVGTGGRAEERKRRRSAPCEGLYGCCKDLVWMLKGKICCCSTGTGVYGAGFVS